MLLIERALGLVEEWPRNIGRFVRANRTRFNRLRVEYAAHFPKTLRALNAENIEHNAISSVEHEIENLPDYKERPDEDRVRRAVQYLLETNVPVSLREVGKITKVSFEQLKNEEKLNKIVLEGKRVFRFKQEDEIQNAITVLRGRGLYPSVGAIATYLGRSHRYLHSHKIRT